jgi:hypothetical protein
MDDLASVRGDLQEELTDAGAMPAERDTTSRGYAISAVKSGPLGNRINTLRISIDSKE